MFELNVEQEVKSGHLAMEGKDIPGNENRITLKPYTKRPHFQVLFPYIVCFGHASFLGVLQMGHSILRAFTSAAPSAWNVLPSRLAFLPTSSLCSNVTFSVRIHMTVLY